MRSILLLGLWIVSSSFAFGQSVKSFAQGLEKDLLKDAGTGIGLVVPTMSYDSDEDDRYLDVTWRGLKHRIIIQRILGLGIVVSASASAGYFDARIRENTVRRYALPGSALGLARLDFSTGTFRDKQTGNQMEMVAIRLLSPLISAQNYSYDAFKTSLNQFDDLISKYQSFVSSGEPEILYQDPFVLLEKRAKS